MKRLLYLLLFVVCAFFFSCEDKKPSCSGKQPICEKKGFNYPEDSLIAYILKGTPFEGMTAEEYYEELAKGVNGDLTPEQVDSMEESWAEEDSIRLLMDTLKMSFYFK